MNRGTKIRTILAVATCLNTALMATDVAQFHNATVDLLYRVASVILNFVVVACVTWYNNDYTEAACEGTGLTRQMKAEENGEEFCGAAFEEGYEFHENLKDGDENE